MGRRLIFLGLAGAFPGPTKDIRLSIDFASDTGEFCATRIGEFLNMGDIPHGELDSISGRLFFPHTSVFEMFGRSIAIPLYRKLYADY